MINVACIGAGYWGKNLIRNFDELGCLSAICDGNPEALEAFAKLYPNVAGHSDLDELLLDSNVHAVCIACLLYTSPSPRDKRQSRMPSSA